MNTKICPACNIEFICKNDSIEDCECSTVVLTHTEREKISSLYRDCLCVNCLRKFSLEKGGIV